MVSNETSKQFADDLLIKGFIMSLVPLNLMGNEYLRDWTRFISRGNYNLPGRTKATS